MRYCQDCGAAQDAAATLCRICGHELSTERGTARCLACGELMAPRGSFCVACGAATRSPSGDVAAARGGLPRGETAAVSAAGAGAMLNLSEGFELPDWLKRAAAEQPYDPSQQLTASADPFGLPAGMQAGGSASLATLLAESATGSGGDGKPTLRPRPIPDGDLPGHMPSWLQEPPSAPAEPAARVNPARHDPNTDPTSIISENDLPEWIRQLAAADAAKEAEAQRAATVAAIEARKAEGGAKRPLPGEMESVAPATSPWLARRERSAADAPADSAWQATAAAAPAPPTASNPLAAEQTRVAVNAPMPIHDVAPTAESRPKERATDERAKKLRLALVAALAVAAVILAYLMLLA